jgi:hypothetical protein
LLHVVGQGPAVATIEFFKALLHGGLGLRSRLRGRRLIVLVERPVLGRCLCPDEAGQTDRCDGPRQQTDCCCGARTENGHSLGLLASGGFAGAGLRNA